MPSVSKNPPALAVGSMSKNEVLGLLKQFSYLSFLCYNHIHKNEVSGKTTKAPRPHIGGLSHELEVTNGESRRGFLSA